MFDFSGYEGIDREQQMDVPTIALCCQIFGAAFRKHGAAIDEVIEKEGLTPSEFFAGLFERAADEMPIRIFFNDGV